MGYHKPKLVFITYEGHAWERILCNTLKANYSEAKIVGYQHSYIFKNQHAALKSFDFNFDPHYILTSGEISRKRIINSNIAKNIKIDILGSKRFGDKNSLKIQPAKKFSNRVFVIPEGIESECKILFDFCLNYSLHRDNLEFVFKFHPQMSLKDFVSKNPAYKKLPKNCHWFTNHSFKNSDWVLYRGSTFIVELLKKGLQPIYLSHKSDFNSIDNFEGKVVFNAEINPTNWTNMPKLVYKPHTLGDLEGKYINAGVFMGRAKPLMEVLRQWTATFCEAKEFFNAGATGCDQAPLVITWNNNPNLPIVLDSFEHIMAVYPVEDADWIADSVMIRHDQNLKKAK